MAPSLEVSLPSDTPNVNDRLVSYYSQGLRKKYLIDSTKNLPAPEQKAKAVIKYHPNLEQYLARVETSLRTGALEQEVPEGWPKELTGPLVWTTADFQNESKYIHVLTEDEKMELRNALEHFKGLGLEGQKINPNNFPLPTLGSILQQMAVDLYQGRGFATLRGLDVDAYCTDDATVLFLGVSSYIGNRFGKQDLNGYTIMHVVSRDDEPEDNSQPFHNDTVTDVLALFTQSCLEESGNSMLASAWTVYNELAATRPDLIHTLAKPDWPHDTYGRDPKFYNRALLHSYDEKVIFAFSRRLLVGKPTSPRSASIPGLTEAQAEAIDAIHYIAKKHEIVTPTQKGDMRFINNMGILHSREKFVETETSKRHFVRIWINNEELNWKLPRVLKLAWERVFDDDERPPLWKFEPLSNKDRKLRIASSCD